MLLHANVYSRLQTLFCGCNSSGPAGKASLNAMIKPNHPRPSKPVRIASNRISQRCREEGGLKPSLPIGHVSTQKPETFNWNKPVVVSGEKNAPSLIAPIMRGYDPRRIQALDEIARLSGERPVQWQKPRFGNFEYWLGHQCGWISDSELQHDTRAFEEKRQKAIATSQRFSQQRFSWLEKPKHSEPSDTGEYVPQVNMKLVKDRNLTDSSRRIALFILRHAYQDNRSGRFIGMTVSFIMQGLSLSRRTVQRSLTLLETRGYFRCEVAKGNETRMCIGLIIHLLETLFPKHHRQKWPERRRNPEASKLPHKQDQFYKTIYQAKNKTSRLSWALRCMNAVTRNTFDRVPVAVGGGRFHTLNASFLMPLVKSPQHSCIQPM